MANSNAGTRPNSSSDQQEYMDIHNYLDKSKSQGQGAKGESKEVEDLTKFRALYAGKDLNECFALMHMKCLSDIESVRSEVKEVTSKVDNLESYVGLLDESVKHIN